MPKTPPQPDREKLKKEFYNFLLDEGYIKPGEVLLALNIGADWWLDKMFSAKSPSPSGEEHGPHAARFLKGLEKSAQDIFESVTPEKTALMVNMSTPTSPVEDEWEKDIRYRFYAHFKGVIRTGEDSEVADWWISEVSQKNRIPGEWEKEFDRKFCSLYGIKVYEGGKLVMGNPDVDEVKSFIRSAISRARKEERERVVKMIEGMKSSHSGWPYPNPSWNAALTALTDKLK